jgi:two-component system response regulator TtrR
MNDWDRVSMACNSIAIVSADTELRTSLAAHVTRSGVNAETADSLEAWLVAGSAEPVRCLVLDMPPGSLAEPEQIAAFTAVCASRRVLVLTAAGDVPTAVQAIRQGATDVLHRSTAQWHILDRISRFAPAGA